MTHTSATKTLLITGAAKRIGAECARHFHARGYQIIIHYNHSNADAEQLQQSLNQQRAGSAICLQADLCHMDEVQKLAREALAWKGSIDLLINNASSFYPTTFGEITPKMWDDLMGSNLKGAFFLAQALAPSLAQRRGNIINLVDIHANSGLKDYSVYCIAKAGVKMMTKVLARELAPAVRVNAISPGAILWPEQETAQDTDDSSQQEILNRTALQRKGHPDDIAACAWFLAEQSPYSSGQTIRVDGGRAP
ncbi:MAG: pteridine reductase [Gammaproteobacteria bacterium]